MTRTRFALALAAGLAAALAAPAHAEKYAAEFLKVPVGPRAIAMGSAFTAVADDATAPHWNPAGMIYLPYREVLFQHAEQFGSLLNHDYLSGVLPLGGASGKESAIGVSFVRLATDDIPVTPRTGDLRRGDFLDYGPDGVSGTNDPGEGNQSWDPGERLLLTSDNLYFASASDMALTLSYARQWNSHWAFGANLKFVRQSIPGTGAVYDTLQRKVTSVEKETSFGAGLDAGMLYMPTDAVTLGVMFRDLTQTYLSWSNGSKEQVAPTIDTGAGFNFYPAEGHTLTWALALAWGFEERSYDSQISFGAVTADVRTGLEYWYRSTLAVRGGLNGKDLAFGAGLRYKHVGLDYAASLNRFLGSDEADFPDDQDLQTTHLVSVSASW